VFGSIQIRCSRGADWRSSPGNPPIARLLAASLVAAALLAGVAPGAANAAVPPKIGLNVLDHFGGPPTPYEALRMSAAGTSVIRVGFGWGRLQPRKGPFQFNHFDKVMASAAYAGIEVLPILVGAPRWIHSRARAWPDTKKGLKAYDRYAGAIAARYGRNGSFWITNYDLPYKPITTYEVWSEQNRRDMAPKGNRVVKYAELLKHTRKAIGKKDRAARLMVGGMNQRKNRLSIRGTNFLTQLYDVKGARRNIDIVGVHPYGGNSVDPVRITNQFRKALNRSGGRRVPLWITEIGWGTGGEAGPHPLVVDEANQGNKLFEAFTNLIANAARLKLEAILWYSFQDILAPTSGGTWDQHSGLFTQNGTKKPAWDAYASVAGGFAGGNLVEPTPPAPAPEPEPPAP
jgi:hypothetical protein